MKKTKRQREVTVKSVFTRWLKSWNVMCLVPALLTCWHLLKDPIILISFFFSFRRCCFRNLVVPAVWLGCGISSLTVLEAFDVELALHLWILSRYFTGFFFPTVQRHRHDANWEPIQGVTLPSPQDSRDSVQHPCNTA